MSVDFDRLSEPTKHTQACGQDGRRTNNRKIGKILKLAFKKEERGMDKAKYIKKLTKNQELKIKENMRCHVIPLREKIDIGQ